MLLGLIRLMSPGGADTRKEKANQMTGAMNSAIAGLKTHMDKLSVIGNNVANVNTVGYKAQRTVFQDSMYTMYSNGSDGTAVKGGKNPSQIGYGSMISTIDLNMTGGIFTPGKPLDTMINGDGYFMVGDKNLANNINAADPNSFKSLSLSRVGNFKFDSDGYLTDGAGNTVYGFLTVGTDPEGNPIVSDQLVPIRLPRVEKVAVDPKDGKTEIPVNPGMVEGKDFIYANKVRYPVAAEVNGKPATDAQLMGKVDNVKLDDYWPANPNGGPIDKSGTNPLPIAELDAIAIDEKSGRISGTTSGGEVITIGYLAVGRVTNNEGLTHTDGPYFRCGDGAGDLQVAMIGGSNEKLKTPGNGKFNTVNGSLLAAGQTASRKAEIISAGKTKFQTGGLEGSNADLAVEIAEMIKTQRGYQANSRIITVTDSMLEELVNMKR